MNTSTCIITIILCCLTSCKNASLQDGANLNNLNVQEQDLVHEDTLESGLLEKIFVSETTGHVEERDTSRTLLLQTDNLMSKMKFDTVKVDRYDFTSEGEEVVYYYKNYRLVKIQLRAFGSMSSSETMFLIENRKVLYLNTSIYSYEKPIGNSNGPGMIDTSQQNTVLEYENSGLRDSITSLVNVYLSLLPRNN